MLEIYYLFFIHICTVPWIRTIDKLYTQIGNVFRLPWELNLLLPCFGLSALYSRKYWNKQKSANTETADPACGITQQWYWHGTVWQGLVRFNLTEDESATFISNLAILFIYAVTLKSAKKCFISHFYRLHLEQSFFLRYL